jgi:hypothetical protein
MNESSAELRQIQARLARTRLALVTQMRRHGPASRDGSDRDPGNTDGDSGLAAVLRRWWHGHPLHLALEVATPVLQTFARAYPLPVLALAGALGAALVWLRPWRLLPLSALLMATARSVPLGDLLAAWRAQAERSAASAAKDTGDTMPRHDASPR